MKKWIKKTWAWIVGLITPTIIVLISKELEEIPFFSNIWKGICCVGDGFIWVMTINIKLWWILSFIAILVILLFVANWVCELKKKKLSAKDIISKQPKFLKYTEDNIKGLVWTWGWYKQYGEEWSIENLTPCCPKDKTPLGFLDTCPRCGYPAPFGLADHESATIIILDNIKKSHLNEIE